MNPMGSAAPRGPAGSSSGNNRAGANFAGSNLQNFMSSITGGRAKRSTGRGGLEGDIIPKGYRAGQLQQFTPEQMQHFQSLFPFLGEGSYLQRLAGGDESLFEEMEAPAKRQFQELQGGLASRFSGLGMGSRHGSGFQNAANQQTIDFATQLQSNRQNLQRQGLKDLYELSNMLLGQRPYERTLQRKPEEQSSGWPSLIGAGVGAAGGFFAGGPMGALQGAQIGYGVGSGF